MNESETQWCSLAVLGNMSKMWGRIVSVVPYVTPNGFGRIRIETISYEYETIDLIQIRAAILFYF